MPRVVLGGCFRRIIGRRLVTNFGGNRILPCFALPLEMHLSCRKSRRHYERILPPFPQRPEMKERCIAVNVLQGINIVHVSCVYLSSKSSRLYLACDHSPTASPVSLSRIRSRVYLPAYSSTEPPRLRVLSVSTDPTAYNVSVDKVVLIPTEVEISLSCFKGLYVFRGFLQFEHCLWPTSSLTLRPVSSSTLGILKKARTSSKHA